MQEIVTDTGPLIHLHESGDLHLLPSLGRVVAPRSVLDEMQALAPEWQAPNWLAIDVPSSSSRARPTGWRDSGILGAGDSKAIAPALDLHLPWLLTDDAVARHVAQQLGLEVHGSLGIVILAAAKGILPEALAERALDALFQSSLWIFSQVEREAPSTSHPFSARAMVPIRLAKQ